MEGLRVLVAEDREELRSVVVALLSSEFQVVGAVGDGEQLVQAAISFNPDVIVSDIEMPLMDGFSARKDVLSNGIEKPFVFTTMMNIEQLPSNLEEIPVGYVHKTDLVNELRLAVHAVAVGRSYVSRSLRENLESQ